MTWHECATRPRTLMLHRDPHLRRPVNWVPVIMPKACLRHDAGMTFVAGLCAIPNGVIPAKAGTHAPNRPRSRAAL